LILAAEDERNMKMGEHDRLERPPIGATMHQTCARRPLPARRMRSSRP
jgi:hypothetical protein